MRQFLQVCNSASIVGLQTIWVLSDMGGSNEKFYSYLRDGASIHPAVTWPIEQVVVCNPIDPGVKLHIWSCSTHGLKNVRSQAEMSRREGSGSHQFHSLTGIPFGWWSNALALERDMDREVNGGGNFRTTLSNHLVHLDSYSKMNASLAKKPFTAKTLSAIMGHSSSVGNCKKKDWRT
jgi:hypothetical protein